MQYFIISERIFCRRRCGRITYIKRFHIELRNMLYLTSDPSQVCCSRELIYMNSD